MHSIGQLEKGGPVASVHPSTRGLLPKDHGDIGVQGVSKLEERTDRQFPSVLFSLLHQGEGEPGSVG
jgi:hypothetical protein